MSAQQDMKLKRASLVSIGSWIGQRVSVSMSLSPRKPKGELQVLEVLCEVLSVRQAWGYLQCLVRPVSGEGQAWVRIERVRREYERHV